MKIEIEIYDREYVLEAWLSDYKVETEVEECHGIHHVDHETYSIETEIPDLEDSVLEEIWADHSYDLIAEYYS